MTRIILITGGTDGIGKATAIVLAKLKGFEVIIHGRDQTKCENVVKEISEVSGNRSISYVLADLSKLDSVVEMCRDVKARFPHLNTLLLNAGVKSLKRVVTPDGLEQGFQVNHLGYFIVAHHLLDLLKVNPKSRIVVVSSRVYNWYPVDWNDLQYERKPYDMTEAYCRSKTLNHLFGLKLAKNLMGTDVTCNVLEPGVIDTKLLNCGYSGHMGAPIADGIVATTKLCSDPDLDGISGKYFDLKGKVITPVDTVTDSKCQDRLWEISENILKKMNVYDL